MTAQLKNLLTICALFISAQTYAYHYSGNKCVRKTSYERLAESKCKGGTLPYNRTRNMKGHTHRLVCNGDVDNHLRRPQEINFKKWEARIKYDPKRGQQYAIDNLPPVQWKGTVAYKTMETWDWESCDQVTSAYHCGTHTVEYYETVTDAEGKSKRVKRTRQDPNTCHTDITRTETVFCSNEVMEYEAEYLKPDFKIWNPDNPNYFDQLPLKYDLLPGEVESIQVYSTYSNRVTSINPTVKIPKAWNDYNINVNRSGFHCEERKAYGKPRYKFKVGINTIKRNVGNKTPNAFKLPVDHKGRPLNALDWAPSQAGDNFKTPKAYPKAINLLDSAAAALNLMSEQSKKNVKKEVAKHKVEKLTNKDGTEITDIPEDSKYFKNTKVRIRLYDEKKGWWDNHYNTIYTEDLKSVKASMNSFSKDQNIARSETYKLELDKTGVEGKDIYEGWGLQPEDDHLFEIAMYQQNMPLYKQSCEHTPEAQKTWRCKFIGSMLLAWHKESEYYSEPLVIRFETNEYDKRSIGQKIGDWFDFLYW